ncbi:uncharacterized protein B0I36DRAFT_365657 [Microdochium trichocladiopsis]|uniref:Uncharacterized protein n=1 Tax=Microdochium trichocladiopsis TaxID=1682393 RepID=A0A9P8Y028_9PEZI|nr:uncharacterized protein B0I36DRAFT_365657 [Microdochium trichocladiopsis]KAH7026031.1 hypothetical protein B0I36DRAFT_365657 [Microdochium trichocladiopsis]
MFRLATETIEYPWEVSGWNGYCSGFQQCSYKFTFTAEGNETASPQLPFVKASCQGSGPGPAFAQCDILETDDTPTAVSAKLLPSPPSSNQTLNGTLQPAEIQISVQHIDFNNDNIQWNYTGTARTVYNGEDAAAALSFSLKPTEIWGIA